MASFIESNAPWVQLVIDNNIELNVIEPGIPFDSIPELSVESIPVQHREDFTDAFAFKITGRKTNNSLSDNTFQKIADGFKVYNSYLNYNLLLSLKCLFILSLNYILKKTSLLMECMSLIWQCMNVTSW